MHVAPHLSHHVDQIIVTSWLFKDGVFMEDRAAKVIASSVPSSSNVRCSLSNLSLATRSSLISVVEEGKINRDGLSLSIVGRLLRTWKSTRTLSNDWRSMHRSILSMLQTLKVSVRALMRYVTRVSLKGQPQSGPGGGSGEVVSDPLHLCRWS